MKIPTRLLKEGQECLNFYLFSGVCLCCNALFESLHEMAEEYNLKLEMLLEDLNGALMFDGANPSSQEPLGQSREEAPSFHSEK